MHCRCCCSRRHRLRIGIVNKHFTHKWIMGTFYSYGRYTQTSRHQVRLERSYIEIGWLNVTQCVCTQSPLKWSKSITWSRTNKIIQHLSYARATMSTEWYAWWMFLMDDAPNLVVIVQFYLFIYSSNWTMVRSCGSIWFNQWQLQLLPCRNWY